MANRRLLLSLLTAFFVGLGGDGYAQSLRTDFRGLDRDAQLLKEEVLKLNRDLSILAEQLSYPPTTHVTVFVSVDAGELLQLDSVELRIDDKVVANHGYAEGELNALSRGGVHRLYAGNLPMGQHELATLVIGKSSNGKEYRRSTSMIFYKRTNPKIIELRIVKPKGKQPELRLPGSAGYRKVGLIKDPHFGEALFNLYQGKYFLATTGLMAAQETRRLRYHPQEGELVLADLYLSYGLYHKAGRLFTRIIDQGVPPDVAAGARFQLARNWYQRGYLREARRALLRNRDDLSLELQDERRVLLALVLMKLNRYGEGVAILRQLRGKSEWVAYARYNIGVGLIQVGRQKEGIAVLEKIARMRARKGEMQTLRDKANLALGFTFLSVQEPQRAKSHFGDVRLNGPFANKALLGIGWALSARGKHKQSLVPWMELQDRNDIDVAVQESLLAVPYAFSKLQAYRQALQHYEKAIEVYNKEIERLDHAVELLHAGELLSAVVSLEPLSKSEWAGPAEKLPDTPENRYLIPLFASHDFHEALRNYQDLQVLSQNLACLSANMDAYSTMLEARQQRHAEPRPHTMLAAAEVHDLPNQTAGTPSDVDVIGQQEKCASVIGARHWQIGTDYKPSLWQTETANNPLGDGIVVAKWSNQSVQDPKHTESEDLEGFSARIATLRRHASQLKPEVDALSRMHAQYLQELAAAELERQRRQLRAYVTQARFGIARVYDESASSAGNTQW